ncbi:hypothetical protein ACFSHQ_13670 [Gemmobacter lanyuensis]
MGFLGVMVIIRPGFDGFQLASLWSVLAVFGLSVRDVATRRILPASSRHRSQPGALRRWGCWGPGCWWFRAGRRCLT